MAVTRICLVRHGETTWNAEKRLQGQLDIPLNDNGRAQARIAARGLASTPFAAIYSSDLERASSTAAALAEASGLPIQLDKELRERHFGVFQGLTREEATARYPTDYARYHERELDFPIPGGESLAGLASRITATFQRLAAAHPGQNILVVTHGGVLDIMHRLATDKPLQPLRDFTISNAAINWLEWDAGHWRIEKWDDKSHLDASLDEL